MPARVWAAVTGIVAALLVLAVAEVIAVVLGPGSSPLFAVGSMVIDLAPQSVKELTISLFGTGDKVALLLLLSGIVLALACVAGVLEYRRRAWGVILLVAVCFVAMLAVTTRREATALSAAPTVIGMFLGCWFLVTAVARLRSWNAVREAAPGTIAGADPRLARRSFLLLTGLTGVASIVAGVVARTLTASASTVNSIRDALVLPAPATPAAPIPAGSQLDVPGITPYLTENADFYRIDTALQVPRIDPGSWALRIHGDVDRDVVVSFDELLALPLEEHVITLACVSNEVGGDLVGNARWLGFPLRELLRRAGPHADADMVLSTSKDGFTAGTPLATLLDPSAAALLAVGMNGQPLPVEHGFPARMVVPGLYGYVSATKWVVDLEVTRFDRAQGYWTPRGWSALGPVKTQSRIDVPKAGSRRPAGTVPIAGVAWAQHTGIERVEVRIDEGEWQEAILAETAGVDTWVQWMLSARLAPGQHRATVRATDRSGYTQTEQQAPVAPDGATGWHSVAFTVG